MIKIVLIISLLLSNSFCISNNSDLEIVSVYPKIEDLKIVKAYPYSEGQKLNNEIEKTKAQDKYIAENSMGIYTKAELKYIEEIKKISMEEFDKQEEKSEPIIKSKKNISIPIIEKKEAVNIIHKSQVKIENNLKKDEGIKDEKQYEQVEKKQINKASLSSSMYEEILIEIDSISNTMSVKAKIENNFQEIKKYKVSTAKKQIEKPLGYGKITKISINPTWYPTTDTIKTFKKRGINLPSVVPPGNKFNYMGAAKINLTHEVNGKNVYRIHGTLDERTIGTNESAGCVRMKNAQVVELATLINDFSRVKSLNDVTVVLK